MRGGPLAAAARLAVALAALVAAPRPASAEAVECPTCWRVIEDGPCRCPHDDTPLPGRVCPPEPQAPAPEARGGHREGGERRVRPAEAGGTQRARARQPTKAKRVVVRRPAPAPQASHDREREREREESVARDRSDRSDESVPAERAGRQRDPYRRGPAFIAGYRYFGVYDWVGEGNSHAFTIEGYPFGQFVEWLRIGLGLDVGFRTAEAHTDWIMNGFVSLGAQYPWRVSPYGNVQIGGGTVYRRRFGQGLTDGLLTVGVNAGATFRLSRTFVADLSVGYLFLLFDELSFHSPNIRIGLGW